MSQPAPLAAQPARHKLYEFTVRIKRETGQRIEYTALASNSLAVIETALEIYGLCKIDVTPKLRSVK